MFGRSSKDVLVTVLLSSALAAGCGTHGSVAPASIAPALPAGFTSGGSLQVHGEPETDAPVVHFMPQTWDGIHAFQSFDAYVPYDARKTDGSRYDMVWGSGSPPSWSTSNSALLNMFYIPMTTDGDQHNTLSWWQSFHPDWILYKCDRVTPAWSQGLPMVPLDISNPDVASWEVSTYGGKAEDNGYAGLAVDLVGFYNGNNGCGVWSNGKWVQKFSGQKVDPAWNQAVLNWTSIAHAYLQSLPRPLVMAGNHMITTAAPGDPNEVALLANLDIDEDEMGFTNFGNGQVGDAVFNNIVYWMRYAQSIGHAFFVVDKWKTPQVTQAELDWSIATYLMGKRGAASLDVVDSRGYGYEYWFPQYGASIGKPCAKMFASQGVYFREFSGGLSIVNPNRSAFRVTLPQSSYTSIDGGTVTSPITITPESGMVLLSPTSSCT